MSPGQSASIIGNLVVNSPVFTMNNLNLKFAPGSKLTVPAGTKLEIVQGSVLEACTEMWEGIFAPGELFLFQGTVRDAKSALNFTNTSKWNVQMSVLENNRRHMLVSCPQAAAGFSSSYFKDNILRCNPAQMKAPFAGQYTYNAIELYNIRSIYIGREGPVADRNEISDAYRGVYAERVNELYIQNNHFENIKCHNPAGLVCGKGTDLNVAILVNARKITEPHSRLYAGIQGNPFAKNTFNNCTGGIYVLGNVSSYIHLNHMTNIRDYGIHGTGNYFAENVFFAMHNTIHQAKSGIYLYDLRNRPAFIFGNIIKKLTDFNTVPTYGIRIENPLASSQPYAVFVNANEVWQYRFGIHLSQITTPQVMNNLVNTHAHITSYPEGIRINYCPKAHIAENNIYEYGAGIGQSMGIRVEYSPAASTLCNNIHSNQISMFFGGDQLSSTVGANYMHNGRQGIYINYGNIGPQGPGKNPNMNAWIGNTWQSHFHNYGSDTTHGSFSPFNLKYNGTIFWPIPLLITRNSLSVPFITTMTVQNNNPVPAFVTNCRGNLDNPDGMVLQLFNDTVTYPDSTLYKEEIEWSRELLLYRAVKEDTTGMLDAALYQYKMALELTATGRLDASKDSALTGNYEYAATTLSAVTAEKEVEQKLKEVYAGTFAFLADTTENKRPAETDSLLLYQLAGECPYRFGEAVYTARNVIMAFNPDTLFMNVCEDVDWMLDKSGSINSETEPLARATVYPNPSADDFVVRFESIADAQDAEVTVTDMYGRERGRFYIYRGADMVLIPGAGLEKGVYICTIKIKGETVESIKITKQ